MVLGMRTVRDIRIFENIPMLVRASLNVPVEKLPYHLI